jgi:uracil-DNA glycosylase
MTVSREDLGLPAAYAAVAEAVLRRPGVDAFLGPSAAGVFPTLAPERHVFSALRQTPPERAQVVVLGQDPFPRDLSATGVAFYDGLVKTWDSPMSPSLRNLIKACMITHRALPPAAKVKELRAALKAAGAPQPPEFFARTAAAGVLWLNTALTFASTDVAVLHRHQAFWKPVVEAVFRCVLAARASRGGCVFVLWGAHAQKFKPTIARLAADVACPVRFCLSAHPCVEAFHATAPFTLIRDAERDLQLEPIPWISAAPSPPTRKRVVGVKATD